MCVLGEVVEEGLADGIEEAVKTVVVFPVFKRYREIGGQFIPTCVRDFFVDVFISQNLELPIFQINKEKNARFNFFMMKILFREFSQGAFV